MEIKIAQKPKLQSVSAMEVHAAETPPDVVDATWQSLPPVDINRRRARRGRIVTLDRVDPAHLSFDVMRTKILGIPSSARLDEHRNYLSHAWLRKVGGGREPGFKSGKLAGLPDSSH